MIGYTGVCVCAKPEMRVAVTLGRCATLEILSVTKMQDPLTVSPRERVFFIEILLVQVALHLLQVALYLPS